jgi:orotate phosphoribosyltransferase
MVDPVIAGVFLKWEASEAILAQTLFEKGSIKFGSFEIKNPKLSPSPVYMDLRTADNPKPGPLGALEIEMIAREMFRVVKENGIEYDFVCGVPNAGEPIAEAFRGLVPNRAKRKGVLRKTGEGDNRVVSDFKTSRGFWAGLKEFFCAKGDACRVLILDDVVSGADSKLEAIKAVKGAGYEVAGLAIAIDRGQGGAEYLEKLGYKVFYWKKLSELLGFYYLLGAISWHQRAEILKYIERTRKIIAAS